jgi:hypothetical protein
LSIFIAMKIPVLTLLCAVLLLSCRKESFITSPDARIFITADTLKYDTVFTSTGSITQTFKIVNPNNQKLRLSSVKLSGGNASSYKMNVDGISTPNATNIEISANDSVYVFVQVSINPAAGNLPFIIRDSIQVSYNGNIKQVQLEAWGQNAHFFRNLEINAAETWTNDLPYVILGYLHINANASLRIEKGCRIFVHADAPIVVDGTLLVNGLSDTADRVYFQGDRLDEPYRNFPAGWPGIYFRSSSTDNILQYAVIKNAYQSIAVEGPANTANPKLTLNECIIDNSYDAGIISLDGSISARNCLITNCGKNIVIVKGGTYQFTHCTVASISNSYISHKSPVLTIANHDASSTATLNANFLNCIFWGENGIVDDEVIVSKMGATPFNVNFDHNLWKVKTTPVNVTLTQVINNQPPQFDSVNTSRGYYDFRLRPGSPALNKGTSTGITTDLDGRPRSAGIPDLGSFERQ